MKNIRKILYGLIILNIILIILQVINYTANEEKEENISDPEPRTVVQDKKIYPGGSYKFTYLYDGNVNLDIFYERIYGFVNYLEILNQETMDLSDSELKVYFNNNKDSIKYKTGITDLKLFIELVEQVNKCNVQEEYERIDMVNDTYKNYKDRCSIQMNISYKNGEQVKVIASLSKRSSADIIVKFEPVEKE